MEIFSVTSAQYPDKKDVGSSGAGSCQSSNTQKGYVFWGAC